MKRRDVLKLALAAGGAGALAARGAAAQDEDLLKYLCPPDSFPAPLSRPSPKAEPFAAELFVPPIKRPGMDLLNQAHNITLDFRSMRPTLD